MAVLNFDHTLATFLKIKKDLTKLLHIIVIITQVFFIGFYVYQIVVNVDRLPFLITYISLSSLSFLYLVFYLLKISGKIKSIKRKQSKFVRTIYHIGKYFFKAGAIGLAIYQIIAIETSQTMIFMTAVSTFILLLNIISEVVINYVDKSIDRLIVAFYMDREDNVLNKLISGDLDRNNFAIPDEEVLKEKIRLDKEKFIKPTPINEENNSPWWMKKVTNYLDKRVNKGKKDTVKPEIIDEDK